MIDGVAFGVGVGVEVATDSRVIGVRVGVGELVIPSFDGIASNMIVACDDVVMDGAEVAVGVGEGAAVAILIGAGVGLGVGSATFR